MSCTLLFFSCGSLALRIAVFALCARRFTLSKGGVHVAGFKHAYDRDPSPYAE